MPGLCDLPDEVLLLTVNCGVLHPADLAAVALSCKRLKDVTEDALYAQNRDRDGSSAVDWAAEYGSIATLDKALKHGLRIEPIDAKAPSEPEFNPFQTAVEHGQDSAVTWFLNHGANVSRRVRPRCRCLIDETCILHPAICSRNASMTLLLVSRGAPLEYFSIGRGASGDNYVTALLEASLFGLDTVVEVLVQDHGMNLQIQEALAWAAMDDRNVSTITTLVGLGADIKSCHTTWIRSPLHCALLDGNFAIAHILLDLGASIHPYDYDLNNEDEEYEDYVLEADDMESQPPEASFSPLNDTVAPGIHFLTSISQIYEYSLGQGASDEERRSKKSLFMKRLIELGVDVNMKAFGGWVGEMRLHTPLYFAIQKDDLQDVSMLLAAGAKVNSKMLSIAWVPYSYDEDMEECLKMMKLLLKHGARLDEPAENGRSMLQVLARHSKMGFDGDTSGLHELLLLSTPNNLSREHLTKVLAGCLNDLDWYTSTVLIRHGAHVSSEDELYTIAGTIIEKFKVGSRDLFMDPEKRSMYPEPEIYECMRFTLDMGLSSEDQCLIFYDILRKRQIALAHLFLDRGLATKPEATKYLPAYLMLAASWGNVCVIKRLWKHAQEDVHATLRKSVVHKSIVRGNREAISFLMEHGATPLEFLLPAHVSEELRLSQDIVAAKHTRSGVFINLDRDGRQSAAALSTLRDYKMTVLRAAGRVPTEDFGPYVSPLQLAVRYGHMDIISDLLEHVPQNADASAALCNIHIPCVLTEANEIREMIEKAADLASWSSQLRAK